VQRTVQIRDGRTSTEVLRWTHTDDEGREHAMAEEFVVLDRVGRMQLPAQYLDELSLRDRVRLQLNADHVGVWPGDSRPQAPLNPQAPPDDPPPTRRSRRTAERGDSDD
jgi:hypothetical protein